jgi:hypothetical protein
MFFMSGGRLGAKEECERDTWREDECERSGEKKMSLVVTIVEVPLLKLASLPRLMLLEIVSWLRSETW